MLLCTLQCEGGKNPAVHSAWLMCGPDLLSCPFSSQSYDPFLSRSLSARGAGEEQNRMQPVSFERLLGCSPSSRGARSPLGSVPEHHVDLWTWFDGGLNQNCFRMCSHGPLPALCACSTHLCTAASKQWVWLCVFLHEVPPSFVPLISAGLCYLPHIPRLLQECSELTRTAVSVWENSRALEVGQGVRRWMGVRRWGWRKENRSGC